MLRNTKVSHKSSEIFSVILPIFKSTLNLAHIKCLSMLLGALCTMQTVCLSKLAAAFDNRVSSESSFRRIQRFLAQMALDLDAVAGYLKSRIPFDGPYTLTMDRTNWKFGDVNINALVLGIAYDHMSFPIPFRLLPKRGNSNFKERINIMERLIRLFGRDSIKCLVADREFVGNEWFKWLNDNAIQYHIRIRDNFWVEDPKTGRKIRAQHIFASLKHGEERILYRIYHVCGELCYLAGAVIKDKTGKHEPQILVSFCRPEEAIADYKERWTIETMFKGLKSSGFNIEDTHMVHINRIEQLFGVVIIAYTWAYLVGIAANLKVKAIRTLNNGRRAISLVKYGLNFIADTLFLFNPFRPIKINVFDFLSCTQKNFNSTISPPTVHSRFQSVTPQQTPSKPTARHHVAAEQEAQDFHPRRPALTLLTP